MDSFIRFGKLPLSSCQWQNTDGMMESMPGTAAFDHQNAVTREGANMNGGTGAVHAAGRSGVRRAAQILAPAPVLPLHAWPLVSALELAALPTAVACARLHTKEILWEWKLDALADDAEILVSELLTNADAPRGALLYPRCSREELKGGSWA